MDTKPKNTDDSQWKNEGRKENDFLIDTVKPNEPRKKKYHTKYKEHQTKHQFKSKPCKFELLSSYIIEYTFVYSCA